MKYQKKYLQQLTTFKKICKKLNFSDEFLRAEQKKSKKVLLDGLDGLSYLTCSSKNHCQFHDTLSLLWKGFEPIVKQNAEPSLGF